MPVLPKTFNPTRKLNTPTNAIKKAWGNGRGGRSWRKLRKSILERDCYICKCDDCMRLRLVRVANEVDHIIPLSQGGTDDEDNLRAINSECHKKKTAQESRSRIKKKEGVG
ncbi:MULTISPECIES: HNH endonuclease [unclassified Gilliamella]|uniref:HNH endonuclease n=1 Tax=unclassified Gilliamella TaxID=2685620 RepID=UPI003A5CAC5C